MTNFGSICSEINQLITTFNGMLSAVYHIPLLEENGYFPLEGKCWIGDNQINLGEVAYPGVYVIVGEKLTDIETVLYIGKASFSSSIGKRLDSHLYQTFNKDTNCFEWSSVPCKLLRVYTIDLSNMKFMASALEEFMIDEMRTRFTLVNEVGNY